MPDNHVPESGLNHIEQRIIGIIDSNKNNIESFAEDIAAHPEPGFCEERTAAHVAAFLRELGLDTHGQLARTGVRADWMEQDGPNVTIIGEMDAIGCRTHPMADPHNGTAHACGHHAQLAAMIGAALALADDEVRATLSGSVSFFAVPAEEYIDADKRKILRKEGVGFPGSGKSELIRTGAFDKTDIVLTTHVHMVPVQEDIYLGNPACNGFAAERVTVRGKAAHAAIDPWDGVNALSITSSAIQMMGLMRETFREEDHVRLHNVIRKAGDVINSVPDEAIVETKVRAASLEKIQQIQEMVNRAYDGAAYAFGGKIEKELLQGYMPVLYRPADPVLIQAAQSLGLNYRTVSPTDFNNACTDVGDLTHLFPVLNFTFAGFEGKLHGADFRITDPEKAYIQPAKLLALTTYRLLKDQATSARQIIQDYTPIFTRETYVNYIKEHYQI
jgi:amidohydrolase